MKQLFIIGLGLFSVNLFSIEFITEADVTQVLGADKVIEVNKYAIEPLVDTDHECRDALRSKSGRAYVVKQAGKSSLFLTPSGLRGLRHCTDL